MDIETKHLEYTALRAEIVERFKILHQTLNYCVFLIFIELVILMLMIFLKTDFVLQKTFLLLLSPVYALIAFNYQANQMTMEAAAGHLQSQTYSDWEKFYGNHKVSQRLTSFLKTLPLFFMQVVPLIAFHSGANTRFTSFLFVLDLVLFFITVINFRYKLAK